MPTRPPFNENILRLDDADFPPLPLPASCRDEKNTLRSASEDIHGFLLKDLSVERLNCINEDLWLAGRPMPPRPLNFQLAISRRILVDERVHMHLVWERSRCMHLKPLPRYLLTPKFWELHLTCKEACPCVSKKGDGQDRKACQQKEPYEYGLGFLFSYMALIQYESDFAIAMNHHLLPKDITWEEWFKMSQQLLENGINQKNVNKRYMFGELKLSRLSKIYAFRRSHLLRGYESPYQTYEEFFQEYFGILAAMTIYIALVLAAMQVGLATNYLGSSPPFQSVSTWFTVYSILVPLLMISSVAFGGCVQFVNNLMKIRSFKQQQLAHYETLVTTEC